MSGAIVPQASGGILAGESLLVREQQTLMRGIELCGSHHGMIGSQSASGHKAQCLIHMVGQIPISAEKNRRRRRKFFRISFLQYYGAAAADDLMKIL
jgi:hypothetical protein